MLAIILAVIAGLILVAVAGLLVAASTKPDDFRIERSIEISAAPEKIFPLIDDLNENRRWSPFEKDPNMKRTLSGAPRGKGAIYDWDGNRQVGRGRIAIMDSVPPSKVVMALDMFAPFKAHNTVEFTLKPSGRNTTVTWAMSGQQPFMAKLMNTVINCDKMVGGEFEAGLAKMKTIAEGA